MNELQNERALMRQAEAKIGCALASESPGLATSNIVSSFVNPSQEDERAAFVAVLAARLCVISFANISRISALAADNASRASAKTVVRPDLDRAQLA